MQTFKLNYFLDKYIHPENNERVIFEELLLHLPSLEEHGAWLAGGALRRLILGQKFESDFDFFFGSKESMDEFYAFIKGDTNFKITKEYCNQNNRTLHVTLTPRKDEIADEALEFEEAFAKNADMPTRPSYDFIFQLITINYYSTVETLLDSFDYTICQFATDGENLYLGDTTLFDTVRKKLHINRITYSLATIRRLIKYSKQGFVACNGCLNTILNCRINNPDINDSDATISSID